MASIQGWFKRKFKISLGFVSCQKNKVEKLRLIQKFSGHFGTMPDNPEIWKAVAMADHFEKIQKLPDPIPGCPNFRRVPGYKVSPDS